MQPKQILKRELSFQNAKSDGSISAPVLCTFRENEAKFPNSHNSDFALEAQITTKRHWVLIADDDALVRGSLSAVLESEGYLVDEACDGREAVRRAILHPPDLVLLDLNMPGWDGWTAFTQLDRVTPLVPVIVITARPNQYPKAVQLGVDAFMEKPLNIPVLMQAIQHLTSEDSGRHMHRITNRSFVTKLLGDMQS